MSVVIRIPAPLRRVTGGQEKVEVEGETLGDALVVMEERFPGIKERLLDETGELRHFVNIYINGEDVHFLEGLKTVISAGDEVSIVPAVAGG